LAVRRAGGGGARATHGRGKKNKGNYLGFLGGEPMPISRETVDEMREFLHRLLAEVRSADTIPWTPMTARFYRGVFPQLTIWLPEEESAQLRREFEIELARLKSS